MERKCPRCGSLAARVGMSTSTLLGWQPYYDKDGKYHNEDPNIHTTTYTCSECGQNYSISTRYGESELHWQENDVNKLEDLFYGTDITGDINLRTPEEGVLSLNKDGVLMFTEPPNFIEDNLGTVFNNLNQRTKLTISNEVDIEIIHNDKTYTIDLDLLLQFLAAQGMVKSTDETT